MYEILCACVLKHENLQSTTKPHTRKREKSIDLRGLARVPMEINLTFLGSPLSLRFRITNHIIYIIFAFLALKKSFLSLPKKPRTIYPNNHDPEPTWSGPLANNPPLQTMGKRPCTPLTRSSILPTLGIAPAFH